MAALRASENTPSVIELTSESHLARSPVDQRAQEYGGRSTLDAAESLQCDHHKVARAVKLGLLQGSQTQHGLRIEESSIAEFKKRFRSVEEALEKKRGEARERAKQNQPLNARQLQMLSLLRSGLERQLTVGQWATSTNCCYDSAASDILFLIDGGILGRNLKHGSNTYSLVESRGSEPTPDTTACELLVPPQRVEVYLPSEP
jgi:hypothetical protein